MSVRTVTVSLSALAAVALPLTQPAETAAAAPRQLQDAFTATTMGMTPAGLGLKIQIIEWTDEAGRADVIAALMGDADTSLAKLPTAGYVWPAASPVGYTIKYAQRTPAAGGGERITLVTDKPVGSYDYKKWSTADGTAKARPGYSVIELYLDASGTGVGNLSLGADVVIDDAADTVELATGGSVHNLLANVKREPHA